MPARFGIVRGCWRHFVPRPDDGSFFAERMTIRLARPAHPSDKQTVFHAHQKVAHRADPRVEIEAGNHNADAPGLEPLRAWHPVEVLHFSFRSVAQIERKALHGGWLRNRDPRYEPTLHQILLGTRRAAAGSRRTTTSMRSTTSRSPQGSQTGRSRSTLGCETRCAPSATRTAGSTSPPARPGSRSRGQASWTTPRTPRRPRSLVEIDGIVRAEERVRALEERLLAIERGAGVNGAVRRLARR